MSKKVQRQYSAELKASAVKMVIEELKTLSQVSQDLHIPLQTLHSWVNKGRKGELSGVGTYSPDLVALQTEVRQLKKQLAAAEMEREILKKAAAYLCPLGTLRGTPCQVRVHENLSQDLPFMRHGAIIGCQRHGLL